LIVVNDRIVSTLTRALYLAGKEISKKGGKPGVIFPA